ncbi:MAG: VWA domain-containing protein [Gemmatimonadetes bacterium]|nr:VWA domain-containing protein [Gemmatimonadota bacterium]
MSFLSPLFLLAAAAVAVPLVLHLFHRQEGQRVVFPALRYLLKTEKEHARRIRLRQLLLLLLRCAVVVVLALAGARLVLAGRGAAHPPTAVVVLLDNSLSSGRVLGEDRVLDRLKDAALEGLEAATAEDRVWVLRVGEPWDIAVPGSARAARTRILETGVSGARGDLSSALRRAGQLLADADMGAGEIHLVSDLQASAFDISSAAETGEYPVLVWRGLGDGMPANRYLLEAQMGGGLPPLANRRTELAVGVSGGDPDDEVTVRLFIDGRVRGAAAVGPGQAAVLPIGPFAEGWVEGYAEADPDALRDDDRRWFAVPVRAPPRVGRSGDSGPFVESALEVLEEGGRIVLGGSPDVLLTAAGAGLPDSEVRTVVHPPADPSLLPALNRRLADAGVEWRVRDDVGAGEVTVAENRVPVDLEGVRIRRRYRLEASPGAAGSVLARVSDGTPWLVATEAAGRPVLLIGSPMDDVASTLPVDAAMVPLLEWFVTGWGAGGIRAPGEVGRSLPLPSTATMVEDPVGVRWPVDGSLELRSTRHAGIYRVFAGDSLLELQAVNPPVRESMTEVLDEAGVERSIAGARVVEDPRDWGRVAFTRRQGWESWRALLGVALVLLLLETWLAASGVGPAARTAPISSPSPPRTAS